MSLRATYYERETSWWLRSAGAENLEGPRRNYRGGIYKSLKMGFTFKPEGLGVKK